MTAFQNNTQITYPVNPFHLPIFLFVGLPLLIADVVGNILLLYCVFREKSLHRPSYYLVAAMSVADIAYPFFGFAPASYTAFVKNQWTCRPLVQFCFLVPANIVTTASFLTLLSLTAERYCSIVFPIFHRKSVTTRRVTQHLVVIWSTSIASTVPLFPFSTYENSSCLPYNFTFAVGFSVLGCIGALLLSVLNVHLLLLVRRRLRENKNNRNTDEQNNQRNANTKATKAIATIVIFFVASWLPHILFAIAIAISHKRTAGSAGLGLDNGRKAMTARYLFNGAINPVVYARQNPHFQAAFRKHFRRQEIRVQDVARRAPPTVKTEAWYNLTVWGNNKNSVPTVATWLEKVHRWGRKLANKTLLVAEA